MKSQRETEHIVWVELREIGVKGGVFVDNRDRSGGDGGEVEMERGTVREKGVYLSVSCL